MTSVVDNDILIKGACYGLLETLVAPAETEEPSIGILGAARFVVPKQIGRKAPQRGAIAAVSMFEEFLKRSLLLEPTIVEQAMAADLELAAQKSGLNLDAGESQLCAIVTLRSISLLLTGDKRAIRAIQSLFGSDVRLSSLRQRVKCLEQLMLDLLTAIGSVATLRSTICAESHIDKTLTICFGCRSPEITSEEAVLALKSYIDDLRRDALQILAL